MAHAAKGVVLAQACLPAACYVQGGGGMPAAGWLPVQKKVARWGQAP